LSGYNIESFFTGAFILTIGLTFGGFQTKDLSPAESHQNETLKLLAAEMPKEIAIVNEVEPVSFERTYKKNEQLSPEELKSILYSVGFRGEALRQAWGTAMKESTGRPMSHNKNRSTGDNSYGLFQINMIDSLGPARLKQFDLESNKDLFNPVRNAEIAFFMSDGGKNWSAWNGLTKSAQEWMKEFPE
jgi:hypothetical protein